MTAHVYRQFAELNSSFRDWEAFAHHRTGEVFDADENRWWQILAQAIMGGEGNIDYLYRDSMGYPTTGIGFLIVQAAGAMSAAQYQHAYTEALKYRWKPNEGSSDSTVLTASQVREQVHHFCEATVGMKGGRLDRYKAYSTMRLINPLSYWVWKWKTEPNPGGTRWRLLQSLLPTWRDLPVFIVVAACRLIWVHNFVGGSVAQEKARSKHYRDFEEIGARWYTGALHGQGFFVISHFRDLCRAGAKYYCQTDCAGACSNARDCSFWSRDPRRAPPQQPQPVTPVTRTQPRITAPPSPYKFDIYRVQLRIWDPFVRTAGYDPNEGRTGGTSTHYSVRGDNHLTFGDLGSTTHRVLVTARFKYFYEERNGQKIGHYIGAADIDPGPNSEHRTAGVQKQPVFGPVARYKVEESGTEWEVDNAPIPRNNPDGTMVRWDPRQQNFEAFTIVVNAENPAYPQLAPRIRATLRGWFENNLLKLSLQTTRWPSIGVRITRSRDGQIDDLLPDYQTPIVDAHKDYENYLKRRDASARVPRAQPAQPTDPGPAQMEDTAFLDAQAQTVVNWTHDINWTAGPAPSQTPQQPNEDSPNLVVRTGGRLVWAYEPVGGAGSRPNTRKFQIQVVPFLKSGLPIRVEAEQPFAEMFRAAERDGIHLGANSIWRSWDDQVRIMNKYKSQPGRYALPGRSDHQSGHAMDIGVQVGRGVESLRVHKNAYNWLAAHSYRFGIRRRNWEPWHWEWWTDWSKKGWVDANKDHVWSLHKVTKNYTK